MININKNLLDIHKFPDGTFCLRLDNIYNNEPYEIVWRYEAEEEMAILYYAVRHIRNLEKNRKINLYLPYVPNARMDRTKHEYEVPTLKFFCDFINDLNFDSVTIRDPHSSVTAQLLDRVFCENVSLYINSILNRYPNIDLLCYPDEGACKRYDGLCKPYCYGVKNRDWNTGSITSLEIRGNIPKGSFNILIVDDICCKGGTFLYTAKELKKLGANKIYLYVTHCENTILTGDLINSGLMEKIYTTNSIFTEEHPLIEVLRW